MSVMTKVKYLSKNLFKDVLYRRMTPGLGCKPDRIHLWSDALMQTQDMTGHVLEVGCSIGYNASYSNYLLKRLKKIRPYLCVDTFSGFVDDQFDTDVKEGTKKSQGSMFSASSIELTRWYLNKHGAENIDLLQGDIVTLDEHKLPDEISACLLDVDLLEPIYEGLKKIYPRMQKGGVILVDDCEGEMWQGRKGYEKFMEEMGFEPEFQYGMGILRKL